MKTTTKYCPYCLEPLVGANYCDACGREFIALEALSETQRATAKLCGAEYIWHAVRGYKIVASLACVAACITTLAMIGCHSWFQLFIGLAAGSGIALLILAYARHLFRTRLGVLMASRFDVAVGVFATAFISFAAWPLVALFACI